MGSRGDIAYGDLRRLRRALLDLLASSSKLLVPHDLLNLARLWMRMVALPPRQPSHPVQAHSKTGSDLISYLHRLMLARNVRGQHFARSTAKWDPHTTYDLQQLLFAHGADGRATGWGGAIAFLTVSVAAGPLEIMSLASKSSAKTR